MRLLDTGQALTIQGPAPHQLSRLALPLSQALIRAQRFTFKGDTHALTSKFCTSLTSFHCSCSPYCFPTDAHRQTRILFNRFIPSASALASSSTAPPPTPLSSAEIDEHIQSAFEIASYLRKNVVQGKINEEGVYSLRFTEETERGDNDTIRAPKQTEAREMRPTQPGSEGTVRRRRRKAPVKEEGSAGCCGGASA